MVTMSALEQELTALSQSGQLRGSLHLAQGQEALPAGACAALRPEDCITATYRGHGYVLAKGCDLDAVIAEILGRATGSGGGKGGKMHLFDLSHGLLGTNGIVGAAVGTAVGAALASWIDKRDSVAMTVFGDGAINQGHVHESFNLAALLKLPVIFLCENNLYAEMTPLARSHGNTNLCERAASYGITADQCDGNDPFAVYETVDRAVNRARAGDGPSFIEAATYRTIGHYQADPGTAYRSQTEVDEWRAKSPLGLLAAKLGPRSQLIREAEEKRVRAAVERALKAPLPNTKDALSGVFA